ncbi:MAG: MFS transporter [Ignavibacteriales bacterium]|nr:MFS transporter [Ignavibacteriales bacterium]
MLFALLYASEGAPIGFIWWTLPTELRTLGFPVNEITTLTSLLILPWALKFLWAPLVDILRSPRCTLRSWILSAQTMMVLSLLPLLFVDVSSAHSIVVILFLLHTISAATQDAAIDALCITEVPASERGAVNGWMQAGMLLGRALFGGGAIVVTQYFELKMIIAGLLIFISIVLVIVFIVIPHGPASVVPVSEKRKEFFSRMRLLLRSRTLRLGLLFAVIGGTAYESVGAVAGPFFVDNGLSKDEIGLFFSLLSVIAMLIGALAGGYVVGKIDVFKFVQISTLLVAAAVFFVSILASAEYDGDSTTVLAAMTLLYCAIGVFTASTYTMFMNLTDPNLGATQFSTYMGGTNICESLSAYTVGMLVAQFGYSTSFAVMGGISLLSIAVVNRLKGEHS